MCHQPGPVLPTHTVTRGQMATFLTPAIEHTKTRNSTPNEFGIAFNRVVGQHVSVVDEDGGNRRQLIPMMGFNPVWSPDGMRIAYNGGPDGDGIWVVDADGANRKRLTTDGGHSPDWSPDGNRIAYVGRYLGIWVIAPDGTDRQQLTTGGFGPVWSPDGMRVAYYGGGPGLQYNTGIRVMNSDGTDHRSISNAGVHPAWSPDDTRITYAAYMPDGKSIGGDIWVAKADGTDRERLTDDTRAVLPDWSADGDRIAYQVTSGDRGLYAIDPDGSNPREVARSGHDPHCSPNRRQIVYVSGDAVEFWVMDPDGGNQRLRASLFSTGMRVALPDQSNRQPGAADRTLKTVSEVAQEAVWSPDSKHIAYNIGTAIYLLRADGSNQQRLASRCDFGSVPVWSPDSSRIAFYRTGAIWIVGVDRSEQHSIDNAREPVWSTDGTRIAYTSDAFRGVLVSDADGRDQRRLTEETVSKIAWSPDGGHIAYSNDTVTGEIRIMAANGANKRKLAEGFNLAWSPDGKTIAYTTG